MRWLADSGILISVIEPDDPQHGAIRAAIETLAARGNENCCATQNVAEFWNVSTRVAAARDGFGTGLACCSTKRDFRRYLHLRVHTPADALGPNEPEHRP